MRRMKKVLHLMLPFPQPIVFKISYNVCFVSANNKQYVNR